MKFPWKILGQNWTVLLSNKDEKKERLDSSSGHGTCTETKDTTSTWSLLSNVRGEGGGRQSMPFQGIA